MNNEPRGDTINDRPPNFRHRGDLYLVRCFACEPTFGTENYGAAVATGRCAFCGWTEVLTSTEEPAP